MAAYKISTFKKPYVFQRGFTYIGLMIAVAIMGISLAAVGQMWHNIQTREKEKQLLYIGDQYRKAIAHYYQESPGAAKKYPTSLDELVKDSRYVTTKRYIRKKYKDPITGNEEWGVIPGTNGGIMGVYSLSTDEPLKTGDFRPADSLFENKKKYSEWAFFAPRTSPATTQTQTLATGTAPNQNPAIPQTIPQPPSSIIQPQN
ncbi:type II secretion system protein [Sulfurirhabdus autotrophica]|uniref:Type II secretory pathway pseudopilin PulG n=1 Tax=Sulfurirhabdus autotrophica TaxID=1706046 RepID=A0A4R3YCP8_9PROT|nr:type II secretion system protein [Sulfurirhabdus autotrophica]TCV89621.1 type II secretory pathway pseudopilin PulG [Sulfurirhabdus autotrophica]